MSLLAERPLGSLASLVIVISHHRFKSFADNSNFDHIIGACIYFISSSHHCAATEFDDDLVANDERSQLSLQRSHRGSASQGGGSLQHHHAGEVPHHEMAPRWRGAVRLSPLPYEKKGCFEGAPSRCVSRFMRSISRGLQSTTRARASRPSAPWRRLRDTVTPRANTRPSPTAPWRRLPLYRPSQYYVLVNTHPPSIAPSTLRRSSMAITTHVVKSTRGQLSAFYRPPTHRRDTIGQQSGRSRGMLS